MRLKYRKEHRLLGKTLNCTDLYGKKISGIVRKVSEETGYLYDRETLEGDVAKGVRVWLEVEGRKTLLRGPFFQEREASERKSA